VSFRIAPGEHVALVGSHNGKDDVAFLLARLLMPSSGRIVVAGANFAEVHQAVPGRRVGYATQNAHMFSGTLAHNLYYGLKQRPVGPAVYDEQEAKVQQKRLHDALAAGNSPYDVHADWIDCEAAGVADSSRLIEAALAALSLVEMKREVVLFGLASTIDPQANAAFAAMALDARARIRERVKRDGLEPYIELFDRNAFHSNSSIAENLLFGAPRRMEFHWRISPPTPRSWSCCATSGCWSTSTRGAPKWSAGWSSYPLTFRPTVRCSRRSAISARTICRIPHAAGEDCRRRSDRDLRRREGAACSHSRSGSFPRDIGSACWTRREGGR
jgi:hypothetical protein